MKIDPNPLRTLLPNTVWLHLSQLRADWGPWPKSIYVSAACIEAAFETLPAHQDSNLEVVAAFFRGVLKAIETSPPRELNEFEVQIGLFEFRSGDESSDILLGVRADNNGTIYLAAADDWNSD